MDCIGDATIVARAGIAGFRVGNRHVTDGVGGGSIGADLDTVIEGLYVDVLDRVVAGINYDSC